MDVVCLGKNIDISVIEKNIAVQFVNYVLELEPCELNKVLQINEYSNIDSFSSDEDNSFINVLETKTILLEVVERGARGAKGEDGEDGVSPSAVETFETVNKNLRSWGYSLNYTGVNLTSIVYTSGVNTITKTLNYTGSDLTSIVLSGDTPSGIDLTKTLTYTGADLTGVAYS